MLFKNYCVDKLRKMKYLNRGIILTIDLLISVTATIVSYIYLLTFINKLTVSGSILILLICSAFVSFLLFISTGLYKVIIRHSTIKELPKIFYIVMGKEVLLAIIVYQLQIIPRELIFFCAILDLLFTSFLMIGFRAFVTNVYYSIVNTNGRELYNVFIYSTEGHSPILAEQIKRDPESPYKIKGFLTTNKNKKGILIANEKVFYIDDKKNLKNLFSQHEVTCVIFNSISHFKREKDRLVEFCIQNHIKMLTTGSMHTMNGVNDVYFNIKPVQVEDLLGRDEITIEIDKIAHEVDGKVILVSGAAGSIGTEIVRQLAKFNVKTLVLFDNAETPLHNIQLEMQEHFPDVAIIPVLGDVRSKDRVREVFNEFTPDLVFHAAAYKHVPMVEMNPCESIMVNVWGTINLAQESMSHGVEKFVMISTDKAVNPTNVMGASKRIAELYVQNLNRAKKTRFIVTRFGNVLGSNGSVIPRFRKQIAAGGPVTVTHPDIIRYFMTIPEACRLVLQAATMGEGGEIYLFDMGESVKIVDLARNMISLSGFIPDREIKIEFTGLRPGEKLYEELLTDKELVKASSHHKIYVAPFCLPDPEVLDNNIRSLILAAGRIDVPHTIRLMKTIVPEFISKNSKFEEYDIKK